MPKSNRWIAGYTERGGQPLAVVFDFLDADTSAGVTPELASDLALLLVDTSPEGIESDV